MRSRSNLALVVGAGVLALVLTVIRQSPEGVVSLELDTQEVRAAPGRAQIQRHDLAALKIFNMTLVRIKDRYVDPGRVDPKKMLYAALDGVQFNIPEVLVEPDVARHRVKVTVNDKPEIFETDDVDSPWRLAAKLKKVFRFIEANMNAGADLAKVEYAAVNGMLSTLDPHSVLMDPEQARDMDVSTSGKFGGLGIVIRMIDSKLTVIRPMKNTPASRKGIKAGDHIVKINSDNTENLTSNEAVDRMRGDPKTGVTLWIARKSVEGLMRFDLIRDIIRVDQVEHKLLGKHVGYVKVKQFSKGITSDVADAMRQMSAQGATAWILDLRYNPGGLLEESVQLTDLFVDSGTVVTTVSGRDREARRAERGFGDTTSPLAVLVNGGSASASEIVAGALKNLDRAVIIGTRTFGKGTVQELYDNEDRSKLKLTIAQYLTPGDRSIQNLGIVPDIALQRMYIPEKNDAPEDFVRLLPPTRSYGEKDLDATLVSSYAKDTDKPAYEVPFMVERKKPAPGTDPATRPEDEEDGPDEDEIVEDFEMKFAKDVVSGVSGPSRSKAVAAATKVVNRVRAEEEKRLVGELAKIGVDWTPTAAAAEAGTPNLEVALTTSPQTNVKAGEIVTVTATVKNTGTGTAYRVLPRIHTDDQTFDDTELPVGKVGPGETRSFSAKLRVPKDALDRKNRLGLEVREARNATARVIPTELSVEAAPRPVFAYSYQLIDDGNGDGLVQRGEKYRLQVQLKNTGAGATQQGVVVLRNATGDGVALGKSRVDLKDTPLLPGQVKELEFPLATDATLRGDELVVELMAYDSALDVSSAEKLKFKVQPSVTGQRSHGEVSARQAITIRSGAADDTNVVGTAAKGASYTALGTFGPYTKVKLNAGGSRVGFVPTSSIAQGGSGQGSFAQVWNSTPPVIAVNHKGLETTADTYKLSGQVNDEQKVEDVYIFVSNQSAKIESRKVFYRSNRGSKDAKALAFTADLPLWPGSNMVTVVARANAEVRSVKTMFIYRDPPRTAQQMPADKAIAKP
ncbi:MAG: PDZ domain-containing protein [Deltaproteobacteria bacterium]|nr:PDZ domain-containing protein [Deltaproteobacteria bacterium]MDQ3297350.1 S41 family peptidase [Myxococcota bacterium]